VLPLAPLPVVPAADTTTLPDPHPSPTMAPIVTNELERSQVRADMRPGKASHVPIAFCYVSARRPTPPPRSVVRASAQLGTPSSTCAASSCQEGPARTARRTAGPRTGSMRGCTDARAHCALCQRSPPDAGDRAVPTVRGAARRAGTVARPARPSDGGKSKSKASRVFFALRPPRSLRCWSLCPTSARRTRSRKLGKPTRSRVVQAGGGRARRAYGSARGAPSSLIPPPRFALTRFAVAYVRHTSTPRLEPAAKLRAKKKKSKRMGTQKRRAPPSARGSSRRGQDRLGEPPAQGLPRRHAGLPLRGRRRLMASIDDPAAIAAIPEHLDLRTEPPPVASARSPPRDEA
jgi:hypothetical protein